MDGSNMRINLYVKVFLWILGVIIAIIAGVAEGEDCQSDLIGLEIECLYYMHKGVPALLQDPNHRCCKVIKLADIPCVCTKLTQNIVIPPGYTIEDMLDWQKVLHCLNFCGKSLPPGFKCGHFTVPPIGPPPKC